MRQGDEVAVATDDPAAPDIRTIAGVSMVLWLIAREFAPLIGLGGIQFLLGACLLVAIIDAIQHKRDLLTALAFAWVLLQGAAGTEANVRYVGFTPLAAPASAQEEPTPKPRDPFWP